MRPILIALSLSAALLLSATASAQKRRGAEPPTPSAAIRSIQMDLPPLLREVAGNGRLSPVTQALIEVAYPPGFDPNRAWPILIVNATSDERFNSSRTLMHQYVDVATTAGWVVVAADANRRLLVNQDNVRLRLALVTAALLALQLQWPAAASADLAFAGFSGGAKHSGWLAAAFHARERKVIGVFQAGINEESFAKAGEQFDVLNQDFQRIPVFLLGGERDRIASPAAHRRVERRLKKAGVQHVQLVFFDGPRRVDAAPLKDALAWFTSLVSSSR